MSDPRTDLDAKLEAEIEAALGDQSVWDMLDEAERPGGFGPPRPDRTPRTGTVVSVHGDDVIVEFGPKSQGLSSLEQFDEPPKVGDRLEFIVERFDKKEGLLILSRKGAVSRAQWESLDVGQVVDARCTGTNKGGLEMEIAQHRAFMPASQVDLRHIADLERFVNEKLRCEVIELDRRTGRIILSRRAILEVERAARREEVLANLEVGQEMIGVVTALKPYGAFVDIGGIDGLVHISDLSYSRVHDPKEVVKEGDQINVKVLKIDDSGDPPKISLGLKQTMADPFQAQMDELEEGATVTGRVTSIQPFGAFIEVAPGVEGLIHISELSHERVNRVEQVVKKDEIVTVKVLKVDRDQQRISLSLKALREEAEADQPRTADKSLEKLRAKFGSADRPLKGGLG